MFNCHKVDKVSSIWLGRGEYNDFVNLFKRLKVQIVANFELNFLRRLVKFENILKSSTVSSASPEFKEFEPETSHNVGELIILNKLKIGFRFGKILQVLQNYMRNDLIHATSLQQLALNKEN